MGMKKSIADLRISYERAALNREDLLADPFDQFRAWFALASAEILEPNAMTLATATPDGVPSARVVLLKGIDARGFRFFTNYESQKGQELAANPHAALVFYWDVLHKSVRVVGTVERLSEVDSAEYFHSRPRGSQIGAWTSPQSTVIADRSAIETREQDLKARFQDTDPIPLPDFWGGFRVVPRTIEFWQGRQSRLHDRFRYTRGDDGSWHVERLAP